MLKNVGSNWILLIVTIASTYVLVPFVLNALGPNQYGLWQLISSATGYLTLLVLGVPMATVRFIGKCVAVEDYEEMNRTIATIAGMYLLMGAACVLIGVGMLFGFEKIYAIPIATRYVVRLAFLLVIGSTALGFFGQLPLGILAAHHDFVLRNMLLVCSLVVRFVLFVWLVSITPSLTCVAAVQLLSGVLECVALWVLVLVKYPLVRLKLGAFRWDVVREVLAYSISVLMLNAGLQLTFQTDALVIGKFASVDQIPCYSIANNVALYVIQFVTGIAAVVMPMATKLETQGQSQELKHLLFKWSKLVLSITVFSTVCLMFLGSSFIATWVGASFGKTGGLVLQILMLGNIVFLPIRGVALPILMGVGKPGKATIALLASGVLNLVMSMALIKHWGLAGVAIGTSIPNVLFALATLFIIARELRFSVRAYATYVATRVLVASVPVALLLWALTSKAQNIGYLGMLLYSAAAGLVFAIACIVFVYRNDPYVDVHAHVSQLFRWRLA